MKHNCDIIVYDIETGGFKYQVNPICEIAFICLNWQLEEKDRLQILIAPHDKGNWGDKDKPFGVYESQALAINKLTMKEIENGTSSDIAIQKIIKLFEDSKKRTSKKPILAGHNIISFDNPYLANFFERHKKDLFKYVEKEMFIDTMWFGRLKYEESENYKLGTCCANESIDLLGENAHTAYGDVQVNTDLVKVYLNNLRGVGQGDSSIKQTRFRDQFKF